jgi:hypothetical protein
MSHDPDCVFCQIAANTGKCLLLAEDPEALAFMDIHPANPRPLPGHPERPLVDGVRHFPGCLRRGCPADGTGRSRRAACARSPLV